MWPTRASYDDDSDQSQEAWFLCKRYAMNRIRVVEEGATTATDIGLDEYGALYEEPGRHRYGAYRWSDTCRLGRWNCIAALDANLEAGHVYVVTFRWTFLARGSLATFGRLDRLRQDTEDARASGSGARR